MTETKTKTKLSPTCQLLILKEEWRKKMKRDLHMMQLHKQLQATFNFLGKAVCFFKSAHIQCRVKNACYLLFNILRAIFESKTPSQIFVFDSRVFVGGLRHDKFCECKQYPLTENVSRRGRGSGEVLARNLWIVDIPAGSASPLIFPPSTSVLCNYKLSSSLSSSPSSSSSKFKLSVNSLQASYRINTLPPSPLHWTYFLSEPTHMKPKRSALWNSNTWQWSGQDFFLI